MAFALLNNEIKQGSDIFDDDFDLCQICSVEDKRIAAAAFCCDCESFLCEQCEEHHTAHRSTKDESLVNTSQAKNAMPLVTYTNDKCSRKCTIHKEKTVKYFCKSHSHFGCSICTTNELKGCDDVDHIPTVAADIRGHERFKTFEKGLNDVEIVYKECIADVKQSLQNIQADEEKLKDSFKGFRIKMNKVLDKVERETLDQIRTVMNKDTLELKTLSKGLEEQHSDVSMLMKEVCDLLSRGENCDAYVLVQAGLEQLDSFQDFLVGATEGKTYQRYSFRPNKHVLKLILKDGALGKPKTRTETINKCSARNSTAKSSESMAVSSCFPLTKSSYDLMLTFAETKKLPGAPYAAMKKRDLLAMAEKMKPGVRVRRGRDWDQGHQSKSSESMAVSSCFPLTKSSYDLMLTFAETKKLPGAPYAAMKKRDLLAMAEKMKPGVRVRRGRDWDQGYHPCCVDGGPGGLGTVEGPAEELGPGWYRVLWDTGCCGHHRMGSSVGGCYELEIV